MDLLKQKRLLQSNTPGSFSGLMSLYESNYQRLVRLVPETDFPFDKAVSRSELDRDLHLTVLERAKYTVTLHLSYWFTEGKASVPDPDLRIRVYRDAELAEVQHVGHFSRIADRTGFDPADETMLRSKWGRNLLLNKWLEFLLSHGHGFAGAGRPRRKA